MMLSRIRPHLTYANTVATLALFVALGGSSYAAVKVSGRDVKDGSLTGKDVKRNSLGGKSIKESSLRVASGSLRGIARRCPARTVMVPGGTCMERSTRSPLIYGQAVGNCASKTGGFDAGRRLPGPDELDGAIGSAIVNGQPGGELTNSLQSTGPTRGTVVMVTSGGGAGITVSDVNTPRPYRCVIDPL